MHAFNLLYSDAVLVIAPRYIPCVMNLCYDGVWFGAGGLVRRVLVWIDEVCCRPKTVLHGMPCLILWCVEIVSVYASKRQLRIQLLYRLVAFGVWVLVAPFPVTSSPTLLVG